MTVAYQSRRTVVDFSSAVTSGLFDGDAFLDVVFANYSQANRVCLGDGSGAFTGCANVSADTNSSAGVTSGLFDGDAFLDVVFANYSQVNRVYLNAATTLSVEKVGAPQSVLPGGQLTYTVTVTNTGLFDAAGVVATDVLPGEVALVSTNGCAEDPTAVPTCTLGTIVAGGSAQYTIIVTVGAATPPGTVLTNAVTVDWTANILAAQTTQTETTVAQSPPQPEPEPTPARTGTEQVAAAGVLPFTGSRRLPTLAGIAAGLLAIGALIARYGRRHG